MVTAARHLLLEALLLAAQLLASEASSLHLAELCRGGTCPDPRFPLLDYDEEAGTCLCRAHPCWNNNGVAHSCPETEFPYLHFRYTADKSLECSCSKWPQYDSLHVSRDLCAGEFCDTDVHPVLEWDKAQQHCVCRRHPCQDPAVTPDSATQRGCVEPATPILHYREDWAVDGSGLPVCECVSKFEVPTSGLRGPRPQGSAQCTWTNSEKRM